MSRSAVCCARSRSFTCRAGSGESSAGQTDSGAVIYAIQVSEPLRRSVPPELTVTLEVDPRAPAAPAFKVPPLALTVVAPRESIVSRQDERARSGFNNACSGGANDVGGNIQRRGVVGGADGKGRECYP